MGKAKVGIVSLGCAKNTVDSEVMLGLLRAAGYEITADPGQAEVIIINTCAFIGPAKKESIDTILEMARYKEEGRARALLVAGCLAQRYPAELAAELPEVDGFFGTNEVDKVVEVVERTLSGERPVLTSRSPSFLYTEELPRVVSTPRPTAYIKLAEGCNHPCTFCIIPRLRGRLRSRPIESVVAEARRLVEDGARELILVAQDTSAYGTDIYGEPRLADLLRQLDAIDGVRWIRILYTYPASISDQLLEAIAELPHVCKYVDLPLQHADDRVLARMRRPGGRADLERLVARIRERVPGVTLRSAFIVGFPGETDEEFANLISFLQEMEFDHTGIFTYSREEGTLSARYPDQIPERVKRERRAEAMRVQQEISYRRRLARVGQEVLVLLEGERSSRVLVGRTEGQAPEVDGNVLVRRPLARGDMAEKLLPGRFARVRLTGARPYDWVGEPLDVVGC
ncbi:MAG: 30S ribosomal protein S12 methylthiotransferase RimO [Limnochordales bacterium]|nr:30S ribosomal protein S12 methylthiotransferase RimO [Limnochordales bacterium]